MQMDMMKRSQMEQIRRIQQLKQIEKENILEQMKDKNKLTDAIFRPLKIEGDNEDVSDKWNKKKDDFTPNRELYWELRKNKPIQPYKNIMDKKDIPDQINEKEELIVHKVTDADKEGVTEDFEKMEGELEKHNGELKIIYSASEYNKHKQKFEYTHKYKYRYKHNAASHQELKEDKTEYFKREQKKLEKGKTDLDKILSHLEDEGLLNENEENEKENLDKIMNTLDDGNNGKKHKKNNKKHKKHKKKKDDLDEIMITIDDDEMPKKKKSKKVIVQEIKIKKKNKNTKKNFDSGFDFNVTYKNNFSETKEFSETREKEI